ncbi:MAG: DUF4357 domain-containing protein [Bacteroidales bacterium]|jgi:hypothetical protein|nr:DUF4357 domain-containing protein [Bacteroidales bacterium]
MKCKDEIFYLKSRKNDYCAMLQLENGKFVLKKGSTVASRVSEKFKSFRTVIKRRENAGINNQNLELTSDLVFNSASVAGEFVAGSSCNGPSSWKNDKGVTLKEWMVKQNDCSNP